MKKIIIILVTFIVLVGGLYLGSKIYVGSRVKSIVNETIEGNEDNQL